MARIRTVKPEFWTHPIMGRLDDSSKCLALALLNFADDEGYFLADPNLVRSSCRPFDDDSTIVRRCLDILVKSEWIQLKNHPTHGAIGCILSFNVHQKIDRPKESTLKTYFIDDDSTISQRLIAVGKEGNGKEGNGRGRRRKAADVIHGFSEDVKKVVNELISIWPVEGTEDRTSPTSPQDFCQRVSEILEAGHDPDILIQAAKDYISIQKKKYAAPQFFFGKTGYQGKGEAPWVGFVKFIITKREHASSAS